jgi:signal transduction histidine kinase
VLLNLLGNAVKFTRNGLIRFHVRCTGSDQVQFIVEDTGIGIPTESCARIFEPFYQVRESANPSGVGLGLSVSAQLCQRMGGDISVESVVGEGTRFVVNLPQHCECHG